MTRQRELQGFLIAIIGFCLSLLFFQILTYNDPKGWYLNLSIWSFLMTSCLYVPLTSPRGEP
jgi:hypothetical protein